MSEDGVTVTSADGEAEDGALRALREDQAKLDDGSRPEVDVRLLQQ